MAADGDTIQIDQVLYSGAGCAFSQIISLTPAYDYVHPTCGETRSIVGPAIDIGAYEFGNSGTMLVCQ